MLPARVFARLALVAVALCCFYPAAAGAQTETAETIPFADFLRMFAGQPDHSADWEIVFDEAKLGVYLKKHIRYAKKQGQTRQEFYPLEAVKRLSKTDREYRLFVIFQPGRPTLALDPQAKTYTEMPDGFSAVPLDVDELVNRVRQVADKTKVQQVGTVSVGGHQAIKIRVAIEGEGDVFFYFAKDLKGLLIRVDSGAEQGTRLTVSNASFDVSDDLFQVPQNYRQVSMDTFMTPMKQKESTGRGNKSIPPVDPVNTSQGLPGPSSGKTTPPGVAADAATNVDSQPVLLSDPKPSYTEEARRNQIRGVVILRLLVDANGTVKQVKVTAGLPDGLDGKAVEAAYKRRYKPAMKNGRPVACWVKTEVEFTLDDK